MKKRAMVSKNNSINSCVSSSSNNENNSKVNNTQAPLKIKNKNKSGKQAPKVELTILSRQHPSAYKGGQVNYPGTYCGEDSFPPTVTTAPVADYSFSNGSYDNAFFSNNSDSLSDIPGIQRLNTRNVRQ